MLMRKRNLQSKIMIKPFASFSYLGKPPFSNISNGDLGNGFCMQLLQKKLKVTKSLNNCGTTRLLHLNLE